MPKACRTVACAVVSALCLTGCSLFHFDQRSQIAYRLLFEATGEPDTEAITQALLAKFPPGTPIASLRQFVKGLGGSCDDKNTWCYIPTRGQYCYSFMIGIAITTKDDSIVYLRASRDGVGC